MEFTCTVARCDPAKMSPSLAQVYARWQDERGAAPGPNWRSVDLIRLPGDVIPWSSLIDITGPGSAGMVFRYWGSERAAMSGMDLTGRTVADVHPDFLRDKVYAEYRQVLEDRAPVHVTTTVTRQGNPISYEALRAPLSRNGRDIAGLFSVLMYIGDVVLTSQTLFNAG